MGRTAGRHVIDDDGMITSWEIHGLVNTCTLLCVVDIHVYAYM